MSYYWFNKQELRKKAKKNKKQKQNHNNGDKEKAPKYYLDNRDVLKEKAKMFIETC